MCRDDNECFEVVVDSTINSLLINSENLVKSVQELDVTFEEYKSVNQSALRNIEKLCLCMQKSINVLRRKGFGRKNL